MSLTTPDKIRTLQRKLYAKAKAEPGCRPARSCRRACRSGSLAHAWSLAKINDGAPGVDGVTFDQGVVRLIANPPPINSVASIPEAGVHPSTGITRLHWSHDPLRLPARPSPEGTFGLQSRRNRGSLVAHRPVSDTIAITPVDLAVLPRGRTSPWPAPTPHVKLTGRRSLRSVAVPGGTSPCVSLHPHLSPP